MNKTYLIGNLGKDTESRTSDSGMLVARNSMAINEKVKDKSTGEWKDAPPTWANLLAFGYNAEKLAVVGKGSTVFVEGRYKTGSYENKEGKTVYTNEFIINQIYKLEFISTKKKEESPEVKGKWSDGDDGDDLPF